MWKQPKILALVVAVAWPVAAFAESGLVLETALRRPVALVANQDSLVVANRSSGTNWAIILLVLVVAIVGIFFLSQMNNAEVAKDNAIAGAADQVGNAAGQVGEAAQNAGNAVEDAVAN